MAYSKELRERAIAHMFPLINASISTASHELNVPYQTLYTWHMRRSNQAATVPAIPESDDSFDPQSKFQVALVTATLNEVNLATYGAPKVNA